MPTTSDSGRYPLIPWPRTLEPRPGEFVFGGGTRAALVPESDHELEALGATLGLPLDGDAGAAGTLTLTLDPRGPAGDESYALEDAPRFRHRGLHLDVGRHFFPVEFVAARRARLGLVPHASSALARAARPPGRGVPPPGLGPAGRRSIVRRCRSRSRSAFATNDSCRRTTGGAAC